MSEQTDKQQNELAILIERFSKPNGTHLTAIPSLFFSRYSHVTGPNYGVHKPSLCIVVQGEKEVLLAQERFKYGPTNYLVASVDLPISGLVIQASSDVPYLALKLEFTPSQILEVSSNFELRTDSKENIKRAMYVDSIEPTMLDAVIRLVRLLDHPEDIPVLASLFTKEILYRVLQGNHGVSLRQMAMEGSSTYRIKEVIEHIMNNYERSFQIEELAEIANMGVSTFHRHFKDVTAMSPIQFQKQLRLQEARRLLLSESTDAADVAFQIGYESPSQFNREYSRMFGYPPIEDVKRLKMNKDKR